ncbi:MAG: NAD(P)-dependent glycerol-3-phosphate dehydrogenase [Atopobiaceae bacterium]|jgi:glycerol-3-phosphate dehydrogenase (NAD(P)+)|nr:NAD(P)-dependent glycerol-3-phosphate dehydrogenase [Atopobiaceae bacterium]
MSERVAVIGAGSWGTAVCGLVAPRASGVVAWSHSPEVADGINTGHMNPRYLAAYRLPDNVTATTDLACALAGATRVLLAVPSAFLRQTTHEMAPLVSDCMPVLVLAKGVEESTGLTLTEVVASELGGPERVAALSGPNHAEEVCLGKVAAAVVAAPEAELGRTFQDLLVSPSFRVYVSEDLVGVETCGAAKNVIAIACGISAGLGFGDNTQALLMTRGLAEISRLVVARGGDPLTCMGLAGMGDLIATCTSEHSRNRTFGEALAAGSSLSDYESKTHMVVEGAAAARSVTDLATRLGVDMPICSAVRQILSGRATYDQEMETLLDRLPDVEFYGLDHRQ